MVRVTFGAFMSLNVNLGHSTPHKVFLVLHHSQPRDLNHYPFALPEFESAR